MNFNFKQLSFWGALLAIFFAVFFTGVFIGKQQVICQVCKPEAVNFSLFWDAYNKLHERFMDPEVLNDQTIIYGAISGMTKSLGDPHTSFFDPKEAKMFEQDLAGSFNGIGIEISVRKNQLIVVAPLKDTPSYRAGIKSGDIIVKIDGKSTNDISSDQAVNLIRGKKGTAVTLTIFREEWKDVRDFKMIRETIKIKSVEWELKDGDVALIRMHQFDQNLSVDFKKIALEILKSPAKKIILDLRDNPGGYLDVCQDVAGWFLENGQIVTVEDFGKNKTKQEYVAQGTASFANYPIVVLMNQGSASASEILAGALRDNRNVKLIGEKSFGKGSVQEVVKLEGSEAFLKITIAKWLTPKGNSIAEIGLTPDIEVTASDRETEPDKDAQLDKALEIIQTLK